jgi:hypothetical protein
MNDYTVFDLERDYVPEEYEAIMRQALRDDSWAAVLEELVMKGV